MVHAGPAIGVKGSQHLGELALGFGHRILGLGADDLDLFELADDQLGGGADLAQSGAEIAHLLVIEPVIRIDGAGCGSDQIFVDLHGRPLLVDHALQAEAVGDATHQVGVAHVLEVGTGGRRLGGILVRGERGLPDLHRVHPGGFVRLLAEDHCLAVVEGGVTVAVNGVLNLLADHVVGQENGLAAFTMEEDVEHVFSVGRSQLANELQILHLGVEYLGFAAAQVVAAGEDQAVVFRQLHAGQADGVDAIHGLGAGIEDQVTPLLFAVGLDLEQDQRAQLGVVDLAVVQGLIGILYRLAVDAEPVVCVVLHLDGEVAAHSLDEDLVENADVGMTAGHLVFAAGDGPLIVV